MRLPNYLGEVVMAEPSLRRLAADGLRVTALGRPWAGSVLSVPGVRFARILEADDETAAYRASGARWGLPLRGSFRTVWRMRRAGLTVVGRRGNLRGPLLYRALPRRRVGHRIDEHLELVLELLATLPMAGRCLGRCASAQERAIPSVTPTPAQVEAGRTRLEASGVQRRFVLCCPTAAHRTPSSFKLWPSFPDFMMRLVSAGEKVLICPGRGEAAWYRGVPEGVHVVEDVPIDELLGIVALARSVVSNDTGTAHLAAATGARTLVLFGETSVERYAARGPRTVCLGTRGRWPTLDEGWEAWRSMDGPSGDPGLLSSGEGSAARRNSAWRRVDFDFDGARC